MFNITERGVRLVFMPFDKKFFMCYTVLAS